MVKTHLLAILAGAVAILAIVVLTGTLLIALIARTRTALARAVTTPAHRRGGGGSRIGGLWRIICLLGTKEA